MSGWLAGAIRRTAAGAARTGGRLFYVAGRPAQPLLLIGSGTGLAPFYGIARDALAGTLVRLSSFTGLGSSTACTTATS